MTPLRRTLDILYALGLGIILSPLILYVAGLVLIKQGRPLFYCSERMSRPDKPFQLIKFRSMTVVETDSGVSGGDKAARITPTGAMLRRTRLDELPQLWNILRGDIGFVGPRPPLRHYVEMFPELYAEVLKDRPGITGLATIAFHKTEERLLARTRTPEETEEIYCRRCVPRKARLDILYARRRNVCSDFRLMCATVFKSVTMHDRKR
ncbi:sugar transferase [Pseudoponticoccus marisrubri]|uniref:Sugar transferase n=1 Tax=Pseudoponticoccus marisrubri TaxID=1685382 RepID=A0A0W7WG56_9RHOB|nr:sugar transferase [Pseudoponticoccus marisrubri]KUF09585.1 sugar transferase [Pseudoponticoccus marisrubri]